MANEIASLYDQLRNSGWGGEWNAGGVDRYQELADLLSKAGVTDISQLSLDRTPYTQSVNVGGTTENGDAMNQQDVTSYHDRLKFGDNYLGYLGDAGGGNGPSDYLQNVGFYGEGNPLAAWSGQGHGNVGYSVVTGPDGKVQIVPNWGSSSDAQTAREAAIVVGSVLGAGYGIDALAGAGAAGGAAGGASEAGAVGGGLSSSDTAALYGNAGYGAGMTGAETAGYGTAGTAAGSTAGAAGTGSTAGAAGTGATAGSTAGGTSGAWNGTNFGGSGNMGWESLIPLASAALQSYGANQAAGQQAAGTQAAIAEQQRQFDLTRGDFAPYRSAGVNALGQLTNEMGQPVTAADVMQDPGYQFGLNQGQQAIDRKIAASGGRVSGQAIKAADRFGTDYATSGYNAAYQRRQDRLNRLAALAGIGQTATNSSAAAGTNASNALSSIYQNQGDNSGAAALAQGNIWGNALNQYGAMYSRSGQQNQTAQPYQPYYATWDNPGP